MRHTLINFKISDNLKVLFLNLHKKLNRAFALRPESIYMIYFCIHIYKQFPFMFLPDNLLHNCTLIWGSKTSNIMVS